MRHTTIARFSKILLCVGVLSLGGWVRRARCEVPGRRAPGSPPTRTGEAPRFVLDLVAAAPLKRALSLQLERMGYVAVPWRSSGGRPPAGLYVSGRVAELRIQAGQSHCAVEYALFQDAHLRWRAVATAQVSGQDAEAEVLCFEALAEQMAEQLAQTRVAR